MSKAKKPELLIPASSLEVLKTAVVFGADAVYIGGEAFGLRAKAKNFSMADMAEGIEFAHSHGVKVYVTANILAHNGDLEGAAEYFRELKTMQPEAPDALIISDPGMYMIARQEWPEVEVHISTQANNTNYQTYLFWWQQGAKRVVSARELSLKEIREIRDHIPEEMEIESFVHGAMCISYSGRCLLSNFFTGRDANQGACTHPCRWKYSIVEETRPGEYMPVYENERGTYIFNSKDLCMIEHIPELVEAGIDSLKIEGRMKTALYVATVARTYRKAIDDYFADETLYHKNMEWYRSEIAKCTYRQFTTGFYFGKPDENTQIYDTNTYINEYTYLGIIEDIKAAGQILPEVQQSETQTAEGRQAEVQQSEVQQVESRKPEVQQSEVQQAESRKPEVQQSEVQQMENRKPEVQQQSEVQQAESRKPEAQPAVQLTGQSLVRIEQRNKFCKGDNIEIMKPDGTNVPVQVLGIYTEEGEEVDSAPHPKQVLWLWLSEQAQVYDLLRVKM